MATSGGESKQANLLDLPCEILELVLTHKEVNHTDLGRVGRVCILLRNVSESNEVWKHKIVQRWPRFLEDYSRHDSYNWKEEYKNRHQLGRLVKRKVAAMSPKYFQRQEISDDGFAEFAVMLADHKHASKYLINEMMSKVHDGQVYKNLTEKYYTGKALRYIKHLHLKEEWAQFLELPLSKQSLEKGAALLALWCQPLEALTVSSICDQLDALAKEVRKELAIRSPDHPACTEGDLQHEDLLENRWTSTQCKVVLETINHVLFSQLGYRGNEEDYYNPHNSYLNKVLERKTGIPISLAVIYISIARRLGVVCYPVNFPSHFLIKWREHPLLSPSQQYTYIDVFAKGKFLSESECGDILDIPLPNMSFRQYYSIASASEVFVRMARNLIGIGRQHGQMGDGLLCLRNAAELFMVLQPSNMETQIMLARLYLHLNINLIEVIDNLQNVSSEDMIAPTGILAYLTESARHQMQEENARNRRPQEITAKLRSNNTEVLYSVGMIMKHTRYHYMCVVYGWDSHCTASKEWIVQMGVHMLPGKDQQPFYNVLVEDGSNRYAAQENLEIPEETSWVPHPEIGKFFKEYRMTHYYPNHEKMSEYPEDVVVTQKYAREKYGTEHQEESSKND